jgi:hypothetical protein
MGGGAAAASAHYGGGIAFEPTDAKRRAPGAQGTPPGMSPRRAGQRSSFDVDWEREQAGARERARERDAERHRDRHAASAAHAVAASPYPFSTSGTPLRSSPGCLCACRRACSLRIFSGRRRPSAAASVRSRLEMPLMLPCASMLIICATDLSWITDKSSFMASPYAARGPQRSGIKEGGSPLASRGVSGRDQHRNQGGSTPAHDRWASPGRDSLRAAGVGASPAMSLSSYRQGARSPARSRGGGL